MSSSLVQTAASALLLILLGDHGHVAWAQSQATLQNSTSFEMQLMMQEAELLPGSTTAQTSGAKQNLTAYDVVLSDPHLSILRLAINETGTQDLYKTPANIPFTYLLPNNKAFHNLLREQSINLTARTGNSTNFYLLKRLLHDPALRIVLAFNIFPLQAVTKADLLKGQTLVSGYGRFNVSVKTVTSGNGTSPAIVDPYNPSASASIVGPEIKLVGASVAYITDKVLRPPFIFEAPGPQSPPAKPCDDVPPSKAYTCKQQKAWGKCDRSWMAGFCRATCGQCHPTPGAASVTKNDGGAATEASQPGFETVAGVGPISVSQSDSNNRRLL